MTDYTDPTTIDVNEVIANINGAFKARGDTWTDTRDWPNVTVKALADEVVRLRAENERLVDVAYRGWLADPHGRGRLADLAEAVTGKRPIVEGEHYGS